MRHTQCVQGTAEGWAVPERFHRSGKHSQGQPRGLENLSGFCPTKAMLPSAQRHVGVFDKSQCPPAFHQVKMVLSTVFYLCQLFKKEILNPFSSKLCNLQSIKLMKSQEKIFSM